MKSERANVMVILICGVTINFFFSLFCNLVRQLLLYTRLSGMRKNLFGQRCLHGGLTHINPIQNRCIKTQAGHA